MSKKALGRGLSALFTQINTLDQNFSELDIDQIEPTHAQPRQIFKENKLKELAQSIKTNGILQPIIVRRSGDRFQIIAGERRWRAAQIAGINKVPCIVKEVPEDQVLELSLIENIQREELNPIEEANAYKRLVEQLGVTQEVIAERVGKDRSSITNSLRLLKLPADIQRFVEDEQLSMGHARALLSINSEEQQKSLAAEIIAKSLSVRETELLVKKARGNENKASAKEQGLNDIESERPNIVAAESKLSAKLAAPVKIKFLQEGGFIEIKFSSRDDLTRLFDLLIQRATP